MPTRSTLENALSDPVRFAPAIDRLGGGKLATTRDGALFISGGIDALVVRLDRPSGESIALRIPIADDGDPDALRVHTAFATDPVIARLRSRSPSPVAGGVSVIPEGLLLRHGRGTPQPFPVIAMEWIGDFTLDDLVRRLAARNDVVRLASLGTQFQRLISVLADARFSHGALAPENVVLRRGDVMAVIDYDTASWPGAPRGRVAQPSGAYRHPSGAAPFVVERRDDFAALVILVSLRALAIDPGMLFPPSEHPDHGLVLSARDLQSPGGSERFRRLSTLDDAETVALAAILAEACTKPVDDVPPFEEAVRAAKAVAGRLRRAGNVPVYQSVYQDEPDATAPERLTSRDRQGRLTRLNAMLIGGADEDAIAYWETSGLAADADARSTAGPLIDAARERLRNAQQPKRPLRQSEPPPAPDPRSSWRVISTGASMARLDQAIARGDREAVLREWPDVQDTPGASRYAPLVHQYATDYWSEAIKQAAWRGDATAVLAAVDGADAAGVAIPAAMRPVIREARQRIEGDTSFGDAAMQTGWANRHPKLASALERDDDRLIANVIDVSRRDDFSDLPAQQRARIELALRRISWAFDVRQALRRRHLDQALRLADQPPAGAEQLLSRIERDRLARIRERGAAQVELNEALTGQSDRAFVQAMRRLEACSAPLPPDLDRRAFNVALDRITRLTALRRAVTSPGADARTIARLVPAALIGGVNWETVERMVNLDDVDRELVRSARVSRIREALKTDDDETIAASAMPDPHDVLRELNVDERARVEAALQRAKPLAGRKSAMTAASDRLKSQPPAGSASGAGTLEPER